MRIGVICTDYEHHGKDSGYKQIVKYIKPAVHIGIVESSNMSFTQKLLQKYPWLYECIAYVKYRKKIDVLHIMYAEDYFRFSAFLFRKIKLVATFHQPVELLKQEVIEGSYRGRIGKITHDITLNRFSKLNAAIITNESQREVLARVMDSSKIHLIPLGTHLAQLNKLFNDNIHSVIEQNERSIITVGNWQRDWDFYFEMVSLLKDVRFVLINRNLSSEYKSKLSNFPNITYYENASDKEMYDLMVQASFQFIPVTAFAGSNAFLQGLALGCPVIITAINIEQLAAEAGEHIVAYTKGDTEDCISKIETWLSKSNKELMDLKMKANAYAQQFSWESTANKTMEIYKLKQ